METNSYRDENRANMVLMQRLKDFTVSEIMSTDLFTLYENDNAYILEEIMKWRTIRHVPVVEDKNILVGIVTHRDLLRATCSIFAGIGKFEQKELNRGIPVANIMKRVVFSTNPDVKLQDAARVMLEHKLGCLPVVDDIKTNKLVGIITEADFVKLFVLTK